MASGYLYVKTYNSRANPSVLNVYDENNNHNLIFSSFSKRSGYNYSYVTSDMFLKSANDNFNLTFEIDGFVTGNYHMNNGTVTLTNLLGYSIPDTSTLIIEPLPSQIYCWKNQNDDCVYTNITFTNTGELFDVFTINGNGNLLLNGSRWTNESEYIMSYGSWGDPV